MPARSQQQREYLNARFGHAWVKRHHFDNKGKLPHTVDKECANVSAIEEDAKQELIRFWTQHPDLRAECVKKYGYDPINQDLSYWKFGLAEPEHAAVRERVEQCGGVFALPEVKEWEKQELAAADVQKNGVPGWAHYRPADTAGQSCLTCDYFTAGRCEMFDNTPVDGGAVCDRWEGRVEKELEPLYVQEEKHSEDPPAALRDKLEQFGEALEPTHKTTAGKLFLISHAKTRYNKPGAPHDIVQGWRDIPLDAQGRVQARNLGTFLRNAGVETIYASSLRRATETAKIAGRVAGVKVQSDDKYRPWNLGSFAGHSSADVVPKLKPFMDDHPDKPVDGGESFNAYQKRFIPALEQLLKLVDKGHTIALITHSRNLELAEGWLGGHGYRSKIDTRAISADEIGPGTVVEVSMKGNKMRYGKTFEVKKAQARPATLNLRVHGMSRTPDGGYSYRMITRDGHYIGRTNPTKHRARKGECLKVQANDFLQDANRNVQWVNPNVVSHYTEMPPHSWNEVLNIIGGNNMLGKDFAEGPAGDAPPSNDVGHASEAMQPNGEAGALAAPEGPTISDVHVNVPLKNISIMYANRRLKYQVQKADKHKQLIYGVVLEPNTLDSQDDWMIPQEVESAAHKYMKNVARGKASVSKLQHTRPGFFKTNKPSLVPVESFIAPTDFTYDGTEMVKKGTWVMVLHCEDPAVWQDVLDGKYTGLSIGGTGIRRDMQIPQSEDGYMRMEPEDWMVGR
jgi:broad specificity phosphatase PhoE